MIIKAGDKDQFLMNRLANSQNRYQNFKEHKRVLCVCSAGLLRSPTAAFVLSQEPWNYNTRAVGIVPDFALIALDQVLLEWADEVVCMSEEQADEVRKMAATFKLSPRILALNIPDNYGYRDPELISLIKISYIAQTEIK